MGRASSLPQGHLDEATRPHLHIPIPGRIVSFYSLILPLHPELFQLFLGSRGPLRHVERHVAWPQTADEMPSLGWARIRSSTMTLPVFSS